ncbi:ABC transporter substrate-binding protein [Haematobacter missouriensis]|uniref:ABC transporter substrate-binding protein n=1 Tax=Haematobacter missouriensis TaxID=366616 RepID=UPI00147049F8|nr:ABC transporter substrate-binding protein [Haematobacter missouriensis]
MKRLARLPQPEAGSPATCWPAPARGAAQQAHPQQAHPQQAHPQQAHPQQAGRRSWVARGMAAGLAAAVTAMTTARAGIWAAVCLMALLPWPAGAEVAITDDAGRQVTLAQPAQRIVLTDGMGFIALALIDPDPAARLAGWNAARLDAGARAEMEAALPALAAVPDIGDPAAGGSVEGLIALSPDLVVLDPFYNRSPTTIRVLESAGISVAVLALTPTIRAEEPHAGLLRLGQLIGREEQARAYAAFADARIAGISARLADLPENARPPVLLEAHAGRGTCCLSPGKGEGIGDFVEFAGGENIGAEVIPGMAGPLSAEYVIARAPQVYIATGGSYLAAAGGLVVGPGADAETARQGLRAAASRTGIAETPAFATQRLHGIWHGLTISAINMVAIEALARWIHPELFPDLDPAATLAEINARFLAAPLTGALWIDAAE